jgi:iron complex transport system permease protein
MGAGGGMGGVPGQGQAGSQGPVERTRTSSRDNLLFSADAPADRGPEYGYDRFRLHKADDVSVYAEEADRRYGWDPRVRVCVLLAAVLVLVFAAALVAPDVLYNGSHVSYSLARWIEDLKTNVSGFAALLSGQAYTSGMGFKLRQFVVAALAGAGLAACGAMYQGAFKNAMASPSTLGVMTGAQLGSVVYILVGGSTTAFGGVVQMSSLQARYDAMDLGSYILATEAQALCSLAGSLVAVGLVLLVAYVAGRGTVSKAGLVIAGSVFSSTISGVVQLIRFYLVEMGDSEQADAVSSIATGTMSSTFQVIDVVLVGVPVLVCLAVLLALGRRMNLLAFSDDEARSLGLSPRASRSLVIGVCTLMTAVITAFCGGIAMVGFLVPLLVRKIAGADFAYVLPASILLGATFAVLANAVTNTALGGMGMGSVTGMVGAVVFLFTAIKQRRERSVDWI